MKRTTLFWILSILVTLLSAYYQRVTGPTYPLSGRATIAGSDIPYRLLRSHGGETDCPVEVVVNDSAVAGALEWKRYKTLDGWNAEKMTSQGGVLCGTLPHQPPAGKLQYRVRLAKGSVQTVIPSELGTIVRFKGDVPIWIIIPHVLAMFMAMMLSLRTGMEYFNPVPNMKRLLLWTLGTLFIGGFILGPAMQWYAFGAWWTGWPFGGDMTDNKTLVAFVGWLAALVVLLRGKDARRWGLAAAIIMFIVYMIPHSVLGSELNYQELDRQKSESAQPK